MKKFLVMLSAGLGIMFLLGLSCPAPGNAGISVNINIPLPGAVIPAPPGLIIIPGSSVYYPPDVDVDLFFYHGYWYRPYGGGWYMGSGYNGPWRVVAPGRVPRPLFGIPHGYRGMSAAYERVPYPTVRRNWRAWEREGHWDNGRHRGWEHGGGHGRGRGRD